MRAWTAIAIAATGLTFQLTVLYPWHEEIHKDFAEIKTIFRRWDQEDEEERNRLRQAAAKKSS